MIRQIFESFEVLEMKHSLHCTLYIGMVQVVSFSLYMGIGAKSRNRLATAKTSLCRVKPTTYML